MMPMSAALPNITTWKTPLSKGTMEAADVLYGITMEESDVSQKVLSPSDARGLS